jgi:hypothetical protein
MFYQEVSYDRAYMVRVRTFNVSHGLLQTRTFLQFYTEANFWSLYVFARDENKSDQLNMPT